MATTPLGFVAVLAGWTTTEAGRQPWVIYGQLRTADAVAPVTAGAVTTTLVVFFAVYMVLLAAFLWHAGRIAICGPEGADVPDPRQVRPGLDRNGPAIVSSEPADAALTAKARPAPGE